jgi:hypothetical protein
MDGIRSFDLPSGYLDLRLSTAERRTQREGEHHTRERALNFLAEPISRKDQRSFEAASAKTCGHRNECCKLARYIVCNWCTILADFLSCCFCRCRRVPTRRSFVPLDLRHKVNGAERWFHINTVGLWILTPSIIVASTLVSMRNDTSPYAPYIGLATNILILFSAGVMTYFFSGDFGGVQRDVKQTLRYRWNDLGKHLSHEWNTGNSGRRQELYQLTQKIGENSRYVFQDYMDLRIGGEDDVQEILTEFNQAVHRVQESATPETHRSETTLDIVFHKEESNSVLTV